MEKIGLMEKQSHHLWWSSILLLINVDCPLGLPWLIMICSSLNFSLIIIYDSNINLLLLIQFHHNLPLPSSWLQALLPASQLPGSYHQSLPDMETLQGLNCFTKRKVLVGQQQPCLLAMEEHQVKLLVGLISLQNMNFKFWPSLLMVMDQKV